MLLVVGHSFRIKGDNESALRLYSLVEGRFPQRPEGAEAGYRKLQILHQQGDAALPAAVKVYAERQAKTDPDSSFIDMAWLMAGEWHFAQAENSASGAGSEFAKKHYGDAAAAYRRVRSEKVDKKYHEARLYKQGWSEIESGDTSEGILTLSRFVQQHSQSALASSALAKRAMAYQAQEDHQFALGDYLDIAKRYPDSPELEFALQQTALIYAHLRKIPEMIQAYRDLLAKFPGPRGRARRTTGSASASSTSNAIRRRSPNFSRPARRIPSLDDKATLRIVISQYHLEDIPQLAIETRRYLENAPAVPKDQPEAPNPRSAPRSLRRSSNTSAASSPRRRNGRTPSFS